MRWWKAFFATLTKELVHQADYRTREAARRSIFEWMEVFYNRERRHTALGGRSPNEYEEATECRSLEPHPQRQASELPSSPPVLGRRIEVSDRRPAPTKATPGRQPPAKSTYTKQPTPSAHKSWGTSGSTDAGSVGTTPTGCTPFTNSKMPRIWSRGGVSVRIWFRGTVNLDRGAVA